MGGRLPALDYSETINGYDLVLVSPMAFLATSAWSCGHPRNCSIARQYQGRFLSSWSF